MQCRKLVTERLPCSGGHDRECVVAFEHGTNYIGLTGAEFVEVEDVAQRAFHLREFACDFGNESAHSFGAAAYIRNRCERRCASWQGECQDGCRMTKVVVEPV